MPLKEANVALELSKQAAAANEAALQSRSMEFIEQCIVPAVENAISDGRTKCDVRMLAGISLPAVRAVLNSKGYILQYQARPRGHSCATSEYVLTISWS